MFSGVPNGPLRLSPPQVHAAVHNSGDSNDETFLRALSLFLSSSFAKYHQFFLSPEFGVKREIATLSALRELPIPLARTPRSKLQEWADLHRELVAASSQAATNGGKQSQFDSLLHQLDEMANDALRLSKAQRARVHDLVHVKLGLSDGKTEEFAVRSPSTDELSDYVHTLCSQLDAFLGESSSMWHSLTVVPGESTGVVEIDLREEPRTAQPVRVLNGSSSGASDLLSLPKQLLEQRSQWLYFQRNLRVYQGTKTYLFKPMQRFHWTRSQAYQDANEIIAETLASGSE